MLCWGGWLRRDLDPMTCQSPDRSCSTALKNTSASRVLKFLPENLECSTCTQKSQRGQDRFLWYFNFYILFYYENGPISILSHAIFLYMPLNSWVGAAIATPGRRRNCNAGIAITTSRPGVNCDAIVITTPAGRVAIAAPTVLLKIDNWKLFNDISPWRDVLLNK